MQIEREFNEVDSGVIEESKRQSIVDGEHVAASKEHQTENTK